MAEVDEWTAEVLAAANRMALCVATYRGAGTDSMRRIQCRRLSAADLALQTWRGQDRLRTYCAVSCVQGSSGIVAHAYVEY
jgi:hypothetical protein